MAGRMKYRPPLRTSEIHAYNFGQRARLSNVELAGLLPYLNYPPLIALLPSELEALDRLGPDEFERWAVKGWLAHE
jgi:hypothetical protein